MRNFGELTGRNSANFALTAFACTELLKVKVFAIELLQTFCVCLRRIYNPPYKLWLFCTRNDDAVSESLDDVGSVDGDSVTSESSSESSKSPDEAEKLSSGVPSAIDLSKPWVDISLLECEGPGLFMVRKRWRTLEIFLMFFALYTVILNSVKCRFDLMLFSSLQFQCLELLQQHEELEEKMQEYYTVCTQLE